jgi:hypothetical protein
MLGYQNDKFTRDLAVKAFSDRAFLMPDDSVAGCVLTVRPLQQSSAKISHCIPPACILVFT